MNAGNSFFVCRIISKVIANSPGLFFRLFQINPKVNILEFQITSAELDMVIMAHTCAGYSLIGPLAILFSFCLCSQLSFLCSSQSYDTPCCKERSLSVFPTSWDRIKEQMLLHEALLSYLIYFLTKGKMTLSNQQRKKKFLKHEIQMIIQSLEKIMLHSVKFRYAFSTTDCELANVVLGCKIMFDFIFIFVCVLTKKKST